MIAKISKGGSFGGAVDYVLDKGKDAELLAGLGVRMKDRDSIVRSFRMQAALNPHLSKPVGHIVLAFSAQDAARLDNRRMVGIAAEYLSGMGIRNTLSSSPATATGNIPICISFSTGWTTTAVPSPTATTATVRSDSARS